MTEQTANRKTRVNLTLDSSVVEMGEALARTERRSLSNQVEVLIDAEWKRRTSAKRPCDCEKATEEAT